MKKKLSLTLLIVILFSLLLTGCNNTTDDKIVLNISNYESYIDEDLLTEYEENNNVKINYVTYPTPEDMYTKVNAGGTDFDVIITGEYMIEKMINEDMLAKIDFNNVSNYQFVNEQFKNQPYDPNNEYAVPYFWGTLGILYNTQTVKEDIGTWDILWNEKYTNKILMMDSQRDAFASALKKLGYSLNTTNIEELQEAKELLINQKPVVMAYVVDEALDMMIAEEADIALIWSGEAVAAMGENENLSYFIPEEGSNIWIDAMCIPKTSKNKEEAEKFINFLTSKEATLRNIDQVWYSTVHTKAIEEVDDFLFENPAFNPSPDDIEKAEMFRDLGDFIKTYDQLWTDVIIE